MAVDREAIFDALFTRISTIPGIRTASRKFLPLDQVEPSAQPALFLAKGGETPKQRRGLPTVWTLEATIYLYCRNDADPKAGPSVQLNRLLREIEGALEMSPEEFAALERNPAIPDDQFREIQANPQGTTLGGLCSHCWIAGTIETDEGTLGDQAVAAIPIEIQTF